MTQGKAKGRNKHNLFFFLFFLTEEENKATVFENSHFLTRARIGGIFVFDLTKEVADGDPYSKAVL